MLMPLMLEMLPAVFPGTLFIDAFSVGNVAGDALNVGNVASIITSDSSLMP